MDHRNGMFLVSKRTRIAVTLALFVLMGCATGARRGSEPMDGASPPMGNPYEKESSVARLGEGRSGFVITESPAMEEESRRDFQDAVARMKGGNYEEAAELLEKVVAHSPGVTAPYVNLAIAYRYLEKPRKAEEHLKTALDLFPGHPLASIEYGLLLRKAGRFAEARGVYERSLAAFPEYYPVHRNLGILCDLYLADLECALKHYEIYSRTVPGDEQVKMWIADLRLRLGH